MADGEKSDAPAPAAGGDGDTADAMGIGGGKVIAATMLAGIAALLAALASVSTTGTLGRIQRNHITLFSFTIALAAVAGACFIYAALVARTDGTPNASKWKTALYFPNWSPKAWRFWGITTMLVAVILGFVGSIKTAGEPERPVVKASLDPKTLQLTGTVTAAHLASRRPLNIVVDGLSATTHVGQVATTTYTRLASNSVGADSDGNATGSISVSVPPARFTAVIVKANVDDDPPADACVEAHAAKAPAPVAVDTGTTPVLPAAAAPVVLPVTIKLASATAGTGCQVLQVPGQEHPTLAASWVGSGTSKLHVVAAGSNLPAGADSIQLLDVVGVRGPKRTSLYRETIAPSATGVIDTAVDVTVRRQFTAVCALLRAATRVTDTRTPGCPTTELPAVAYARLGR